MNSLSNAIDTHLSHDDADDCFWSALRRVAIYLNSKPGQLCQRRWLTLDDQQVADKFQKQGLDSLLVSYLLSIPQGGSYGAVKASNADRAEHEFYGRFQFDKRSNPERLHITFNSTEVFRLWSLERLHKPVTNDEIVQSMFKNNARAAYRAAFTNYLVKNFWHNMIHLRLQNINDLNFHEFGGDARYDSDFVADNIANILLLRAYGYDVKVKGRQPRTTASKYARVFKLNRCNRVFAERAYQRNESLTEIESFLERAWRFKRQIANNLSSKLLSQGAGVTDIAVYFSGSIKPQSSNRGGYYYSGEVIVRVNQCYFNTKLAPYLRDPNAEGQTDEQIKETCLFYKERVQDIVNFSATHYIASLKNNYYLQDYASNVLIALEKRLNSW